MINTMEIIIKKYSDTFPPIGLTSRLIKQSGVSVDIPGKSITLIEGT